jgi:ferredoxin
VRVVIDAERCAGHGRCYALASDLFTDDERGYGQVVADGAVAPEHLDAARRAVGGCPEGAISLLDE